MQNLLFDFIERYVPLSAAEQEAIIALDIFRSVAKGTVLLRAGAHSQVGYFVLRGCLRTYYVVDGKEKTTAFYTEMEGLTPECVLTQQPSEYYLATTEDSILSVSTPAMEATVFAQFPKFETLCRMLSEELLVQQRTQFDLFKISSPEQRYLALVEHRPDLIRRVPQHQLASYIGIQPQSLSRIRARIKK
ncbi:MAG: cyclic nucleotide-binding domain-containing protein [Bacteroidota bacterium]